MHVSLEVFENRLISEQTEDDIDETYQMGDFLSRRCFCSAQGLTQDEACTERSEPFRPIRLCAACHKNM